MEVIKRDGKVVEYDKNKILNAISKAMYSCNHINNRVKNHIADEIEKKYSKAESVTVEEIQNQIEMLLMSSSCKDVAKEYVRYRYKRELIRDNDKAYDNILNLIKLQNQELKEENSNKNAIIASTQRDYMAGEVSKDLSQRLLLPPDIVEAHKKGIIHFHDMDYFSQKIHNCELINLEDMLQNGTCINNVQIDKPHRFLTAMTIATQIITAVTSSQYGGASVSLTHLAPFVRDSYNAYVDKYKRRGMSEEQSQQFAMEDTKKEVADGVQTFNYQCNSMTTTNGQSPFLSVFMYLGETKEYKKELAMIIEEFLNQRILGMKNPVGVYVTPAFPKLLYVLEEDNINEGSPYYYLTELAAKCTAKRLVPDYISEKKMKEFKEEQCYPCMGCVDGGECITYKYKNILYVESFERMWNRLSEYFKVKVLNDRSSYLDVSNVEIYDTQKGFVKTLRVIKNFSDDWYKVKLSGGRSLMCTNDHPFPTNRGRIFAEDLKEGDIIPVNYNQYSENDIEFDTDKAWLLGFLICDSAINTNVNASIAMNGEDDIQKAVVDRVKKCFGLDTHIIERRRGVKGTYKDINILKSSCFADYLRWKFEGTTKNNRHIPSDVFCWNREARLSFMAGMIDADGYIKLADSGKPTVQIGSTNKELALQQMALAQSLGMPSYMYENHYSSKHPEKIRYRIEFQPTEELVSYIVCEKKSSHYQNYDNKQTYTKSTVTSIQKIENYSGYSYDVTTESDHFEVSGIYSHNCRSFLQPYKDENGNYKFYGRFNQGVVTLNLVDVALSSGGDFDKFWKIFDERLELCYRALMCRHNRLLGTVSDVAPIQWQHGAIARLKEHEKIDKYLFGDYSSISLGYAGLYECVKYMTGKSHTENDGKEFALKVMKYMNECCTNWKKETNIGFSLYGSPIESTTYKFAKCLKERFGVIEGITDKEYITNSYHINVREEIDAFSKLKIESEFQALSLGGCISYIEVPNMQQNIPAVLQVIKYIYNNIMYAEINTKSDYCQKCGFDGEILVDDNLEWYCPNCGNKDQDTMNVTRRTCGLTTNSPH